MRAALALEDGRVFVGTGFAAEGVTCGEIVFNTSMTGYYSTFEREDESRAGR